jgi:hypothetical protein
MALMALGVGLGVFALAAVTGIAQAGAASVVLTVVAGVIFTTIGLGMTRTAGLRRQLAVIAGPEPLRAHLLAQRNRSSEGRGGSYALAIGLTRGAMRGHRRSWSYGFPQLVGWDSYRKLGGGGDGDYSAECEWVAVGSGLIAGAGFLSEPLTGPIGAGIGFGAGAVSVGAHLAEAYGACG